MDMLNSAFYLGILLVFINSMFLFTGTLPDGNGGYMTFGILESDRNDMNNFNQSYIDLNQSLLGPDIDGNDIAGASTQDKGYLTLFSDYLLGAQKTVGNGISLAAGVIGIAASVFFGFVFWIDLFINPAWFNGLIYLNILFKVFFIFVQLLALFYIIKDLFGIGTGTRS